MNLLPKHLQVQVLHHLVEGVSVRATNRLTGVSRNTILSLLEDVGAACREYQDKVFRKLPIKKIQCDEIWTFVYAKKKNVTPEMRMNVFAGDAWTWIAADVKSRLIFSWLVGGTREQESADAFMSDVESRLGKKFQMSTDGNRAYLEAIEGGVLAKSRIDYGILMKTYSMKNGKRNPENLQIEKFKVIGHPEEKDISTSYIERFNLTLRTNVRRFTRKTNGFSKKFENLEYHVALFCMYYNFVRVHSTFGKYSTPAMVAGVCDYKWELGDIIDLMNGLKHKGEEGYSAVA